MTKIAIVSLVSSFSIGTLSAETITSLRADDNGHSKLVEASRSGNYYWSSKKAPESGNDYVATHAVRTPASTSASEWTFKGDSLDIRSTYLWVKGLGTLNFDGSLSFSGKNGYFGNWGTAGSLVFNAADFIEIKPDQGYEFGFYPSSDMSAANCVAAHFTFKAPELKAPESSHIYLSQNDKITHADGYQWFNLHFAGDCSKYLGKVEIRKGGCFHFEGTISKFPAIVEVEDGGFFYVNAPMSDVNMSLDAGSSLKITKTGLTAALKALDYRGGDVCLQLDVDKHSVSTLVIEDLLTLKEGIRLKLAVAVTGEITTNVDFSTFAPVLSVPVVSGLTADDVEISLPPMTSGLPSVRLVPFDKDGVRHFCLSAYDVVTLLKSDASGKSSLDSSGNVSNWSTGTFPTPEFDYLVPNGLTLRTADGAYPSLTFGGHALCFDGGTLGMKGPLVAGDIRMSKTGASTPTITSYGLVTNRLSGGTLTLNAYTVIGAVPYCGNWSNGKYGLSNGGYPRDVHPRYTYVDSTLCGSGGLSIRLNSGNANEDFQEPVFVELTADNSKTYTGTIEVKSLYSPYYATAITNDNLAAVLVIRSESNLGGKLPAFNFGSITLNRGALWVCETMSIEDVNRGIDVNANDARFIVDADKTFTVMSQITHRCPLWKLGKGTLALGGKLRFNTSTGTDPKTGLNTLIVKEGFIKPVNTNSYDGLKIVFEKGARVVVDAMPGDAGTSQYGLYVVKMAAGQTSPFDASSNGGHIEFQVSDNSDRMHKRIALCTVSASVPDLSQDLKVFHDYKDYSYRVERTENNDGTVTYSAVFHKGLAVLIK